MAEAYDSGSDETCSPERRRQGVQPQRSCLARLELLKRHLEVCGTTAGWMDGPCRDVHTACGCRGWVPSLKRYMPWTWT